MRRKLLHCRVRGTIHKVLDKLSVVPPDFEALAKSVQRHPDSQRRSAKGIGHSPDHLDVHAMRLHGGLVIHIHRLSVKQHAGPRSSDE